MSTDDLRYNEVRQKSVHNAFQRREGIADQFLYWRIRSMEIDLHRTDIFGDSVGNDWAVYHDWHDPMSSVARFSQFLQICRGLHRTVPQHEVVTLFVDIKDPFPRSAAARQSWRTFDALLDKYLGSVLYRPRDLFDRATRARGLRDAVAQHGWPTLRQLRGRFVVVLTGSDEQLANYAATDLAALNRAAFLSKPVDGASDIPGSGDAVFYNIDGSKRMKLVKRVNPLGYIARAYYIDSNDLWDQAVTNDCHHIATDKVNDRVDPTFSTTARAGFPFERLDNVAVVGTERGTAGGVWARSEDMWAEADDFCFNYRQCSNAKLNNTYDFAIAAANSHTEDFVKGAVLARTGLAANDAYFAVVRPGQKHGLRVQFRPDKGDPTTTMAPPIGPSGHFGHDIDQDTIVHVRLKIDRGGRRARAWGSYDRNTWTALGKFSFDKPLRYQGIGVSSHGQRRGAKFLFMSPKPVDRVQFPNSKLIGEGDLASSDLTGWVDWHDRGRWLTTGFSSFTPSSPPTDPPRSRGDRRA